MLLALIVPLSGLQSLKVPDVGVPNRTDVVLGAFLDNVFLNFVVHTLASFACSLAFGTSYTRFGELASFWFSGLTHALTMILFVEFATAGLDVMVAFALAVAITVTLYMIPWWILHRAAANAAAPSAATPALVG